MRTDPSVIVSASELLALSGFLASNSVHKVQDFVCSKCNNTGKAVEQMDLSGDRVHFAPSYALVSLALSFLY